MRVFLVASVIYHIAPFGELSHSRRECLAHAPAFVKEARCQAI